MVSQEALRSGMKSITRLGGPDDLIQGQNLFDQAPFKSIIQTISRETGTDPMKLNEYLGIITHSSVSNGSLKSSWNTEQWDYWQNVQKCQLRRSEFSSVMQKLGIKDDVSRQKYEHATGKLVSELEIYPYWTMYVSTKQIEQYATDGSPIKKGERYGFPETYAKWAISKLQRKQHLS